MNYRKVVKSMNSDSGKKWVESIESTRIVSDRGQTVIPKSIRDYMDLQAGDKVVWTVNEQGTVMVHTIKKKSIMDLKGIIKQEHYIEDFDKILADAKEQHYLKRNEAGGAQDA
jgi:AbrB family looped-hinge helix DNA binding protein